MSNLLSLAAPLLFAFIATPLLVRGLGNEDYGFYSLVLAVIGFGFTTGIGRIPAKYVPEKRAANEGHELTTLLSATLLITLAVAVVEAALLALTSSFLITRILKIPDEHSGELNTAVYLACFIGAVMMVSQVFQSALQGVHRFLSFALITVAASLFINAGSVLLAANDFPYPDIFILNLTVTVAATSAFFLFAKNHVPELRIQNTFDFSAIRKVGWFAASIFVYQTITSVFYLFERAYIVRNYGAEMLTYYTIPLMLGVYLHALILAFSQVAIPKFNERVANLGALTATYTALTKLVVSAAVFLALIYYCLGDKLLHLWLGEDFASRSFPLLVIDGSAFALIALLIPAWILSEAARKPGINASSPLVTYIIGIVAILFLGSIFGANGVAGGRLVGSLAALPIIPVVEKLVFGRMLTTMWMGILVRVVIASVVLLAVDRGITGVIGDNYLMFPLALFSTTLSFWMTLFLTGYIDRPEINAAFGPSVDPDQNSEMMDAVQ